MNAAKITRLNRDLPFSLLLAEDDALFRCWLADELRTEGFRVLEASSSQDAFSVLRTYPVHVMIVDIDISGRGEGIAVARFARSLRPAPKIIFVLGEEQGETVPEVAMLGSIVSKPCARSDLRELVRESLGLTRGQCG